MADSGKMMPMIPNFASMRSWICLTLVIVMLTSCEPEEPLYSAPKQIQGLQTLMLDLGEDRNRDIWVNLGGVQTVATDGSLWDLGFSCVSGRWDMIINNGNDAWLYRGDTGNINRTFKIPTSGWRYDHPSGDPDSSAIGSWSPDGSSSYGYCYILDRGSNKPAALRYIKFKLGRVENDDYVLRYGGLNDSLTREVRISRQAGKNYAYLSFEKGDTLGAEPLRRDDWDLVFRKYKTNIIETGTGIPYDYVAVGCLLNPNGVQCAEVPADTPVESVTRSYAESLPLSSRLDIIGYDWKQFDRLSGKYTVNYKRIFVIRNTASQWFKLRFIDYYNDLGQRGYPKFEYERL